MRLATFRRMDQFDRRIRQLERSEAEEGEAGPVEWDEIANKPTTFPPTAKQITFASPATEWVINHNIGRTVVEVNCYDPTGTLEFDPEVELTNANTATVRWYYPTAGIAE